MYVFEEIYIWYRNLEDKHHSWQIGPSPVTVAQCLGEWRSMLLSPCHQGHSVHWVMTCIAGESSWQVSTVIPSLWVILFSRLLNFPLLRSPFGEHSHGMQLSAPFFFFFFLPFREVCPHPSVSDFLVTNFQLCFFRVPDHPNLLLQPH